MYRILLPIDSSEERARRAAETVVALPCNPSELDVILLNVHEEVEVSEEGARYRSSDVYNETAFPESVDAAAEILEAAGVQVQRRREHGDPAMVILDVAEEIEADHVVMSGRKRSPTGKVLFGSVAQSVLLAANLPVTMNMND